MPENKSCENCADKACGLSTNKAKERGFPCWRPPEVAEEKPRQPEPEPEVIQGWVQKGKNGEYYIRNTMFIWPVDQIMLDICDKDIRITVERRKRE